MKLIPVEPIGSHTVRGFADYPDKSKSGIEEWEEPVYPAPCPDAVRLGQLRGTLGWRSSLTGIAKLLDISVVDASSLIRGRKVPESWDEVWRLLDGP